MNVHSALGISVSTSVGCLNFNDSDSYSNMVLLKKKKKRVCDTRPFAINWRINGYM